jgi:hypothetical protein
MNDDFYFLRDVRADDVPPYRNGTLTAHIDWRQYTPSVYLDSLRKTEAQLKRAGMPVVDFELHMPMPLNRRVLADVLDDFTFDWSGFPAPCFRSLYGNARRLPGVRAPRGDGKIDEPLAGAEICRRLDEQPFFSTGPGGMNPDMELTLARLFPPL